MTFSTGTRPALERQSNGTGTLDRHPPYGRAPLVPNGNPPAIDHALLDGRHRRFTAAGGRPTDRRATAR